MVPVGVDLPVGTGPRVTVVQAPTADRGVCLVESVVGTKMHRSRDDAAGSRGPVYLAGSGKGAVHFDAYLQVELFVEVQGDVPGGSRDALRPEDVPHRAAGLWDHL